MAVPLIILAIVAAVISNDTGVGGLAFFNAVAAFISNGILSNFGPYDEPPGWALTVSMITTALSIIFLIVGLVS